MQSISRSKDLFLGYRTRQKSEPQDTNAEEASVSLWVILAGVVPMYVHVQEIKEIPDRV